MTRVDVGGAVLCVAAVSLVRSAYAQAPPTPPPFVQSETGITVEFEADRPHLSVFVAPGEIHDTGNLYPDPFVKLGSTPLSVKLVPGVYTVSMESPDIATASTVFEVGFKPVHVRVRSGDAGMRTLGTFLLAIGAASALAAIVIEASFTEKPSGISKSQIAVPLFAVGGVALGGGLAIYLASGTTIEQDGLKTDRRRGFVGVTYRF